MADGGFVAPPDEGCFKEEAWAAAGKAGILDAARVWRSLAVLAGGGPPAEGCLWAACTG